MMRRPLPLFMLSVMMGMAFVVGCRPRGPQQAREGHTIADSADHTLFGVQTTLASATGVKRGELVGDTAFVLNEATTFVFRVLRITFIESTGAPLGTLTADRARYVPVTGLLDLSGNIVLTAVSGRQARAQSGHYVTGANTITLDSGATVQSNGTATHPKTVTTDPGLTRVTCEPACQ